MLKRISYSALTLALVLNLLVGAQVYLASAETAAKDDVYQNLEVFARALERVRKDYVDGENLTYRELISNALQGMLSNLDPHSEFMDSTKFEELKEDTEGAFGGVGLVVGVRGESLVVISPMEGTPAFRAGILKGDEIVKIDGHNTERSALPEAVRLLRGKPGTEVEVTVRRPGSNQLRDVKLTREVIKVNTVRDLDGGQEFKLRDDKIGYVRLLQFGEPTSGELDSALKKLDDQGMKALILDLRGNPGGLLDQAVKVCEKFLPRDQLMVSTEGRREDDRVQYRTVRRGKYADLTMALLVDGGSASASEIVAACMQDSTTNGVARAVLVGEQTFGKGSVQKIIPFPNGDALRLTTAKYYSPNHRVIHMKGVTPDITVTLSDQEAAALFYRGRGGIETAPPERQSELGGVQDAQLERAVEVLKGLALFSKREGRVEKATASRASDTSAR